MARIICLADSARLVRAVHHTLREHALLPLPGARLSEALRATIREASAELVLLELNHSLDNPHLFFFLRSDQATRHLPIVALAESSSAAIQAEALGADAFVRTPFGPDELRNAVDAFLTPLCPAPLSAFELPRYPTPLPIRPPALPGLAPAYVVA